MSIQARLPDEEMEALPAGKAGEERLKQHIVESVNEYEAFVRQNYPEPFNDRLDKYERAAIQSYMLWLMTHRPDVKALNVKNESESPLALVK